MWRFTHQNQQPTGKPALKMSHCILVLAWLAVIGIGWWHQAQIWILTTNSMQPSLPRGSLVLTLPRPRYEPGAIITFYAKSARRQVVTHRIVARLDEASQSVYRTKGDANEAADASLIADHLVIGEVRFALPARWPSVVQARGYDLVAQHSQSWHTATEFAPAPLPTDLAQSQPSPTAAASPSASPLSMPDSIAVTSLSQVALTAHCREAKLEPASVMLEFDPIELSPLGAPHDALQAISFSYRLAADFWPDIVFPVFTLERDHELLFEHTLGQPNGYWQTVLLPAALTKSQLEAQAKQQLLVGIPATICTHDAHVELRSFRLVPHPRTPSWLGTINHLEAWDEGDGQLSMIFDWASEASSATSPTDTVPGDQLISFVVELTNTQTGERLNRVPVWHQRSGSARTRAAPTQHLDVVLNNVPSGPYRLVLRAIDAFTNEIALAETSITTTPE